MKDCASTMSRTTICGEMKEICVFLQNEAINNGLLANLNLALQKESDEYLMMLVENKAGSAYKSCAKHRLIAETAQQVLDSRK